VNLTVRILASLVVAPTLARFLIFVLRRRGRVRQDTRRESNDLFYYDDGAVIDLSQYDDWSYDESRAHQPNMMEEA
jgi:hypothetical protein